MAKLSVVTAVEIAPEGDWIAPGGDMDDIEFLTVGFTDRYIDAQAVAHRRLARAYGDDIGRVPVAALRKVNLECLLKHAVFGIRNLKDENDQEVTWEQAKKMVFEARFKPLGDGMFAAARLAGSRRAVDLEDAEGNSGKSSGTSSNGDSTTS
jgi:hypothetical protein